MAILWFCGVVFVGVPTAHAGVTVSPPRVVLQGKPSKVLTGIFMVENRGEAPIDVRVEPEDWSKGLSGTRGAVTWLTVKPTRLNLRPGRGAQVKYTIRIPKDASGELRTQVFFTTEERGEGGMSMRSRLGAIIYVGVEGTEQLAGAITHVGATYTASTPGMKQPDRLDVLLRIHNRGNTHIVPEGKVVVRDRDGRSVASATLSPGWGLLPKEEDAYHVIGQGIYLKPGTYTLEITIQIGTDLRHPVSLTKTMDAELAKDGTWHLHEPAPASP